MRLYSLQYLRAIAAAGVVLVHASTTLAGREGAKLLFGVGSYGVDLFFVISGFVMFYTTADRPTTPGNFLLRRCIRIIPIYFLLTTFAFALALLAPKLSNTFSPSLADYVRSILFIPYFNRFYDDFRPELQQGWTLNYEMFFYLVFACCIWLKARYRVLVCMGVFAVLVAIGIRTAPEEVYAKIYTNPIMLEFVFGAILGYFLVLHQAIFSRLVVVLLAAAVATLVCVSWLGIHERVLFAGVPSAAIIGGAIWLERRGRMPHWPVFVLVGDSSYSLYLVHTFVLSGIKRFFVRVLDPSLATVQFAYMVCGLGLAIVIGILFYKKVEAPLTKLLQALIKRSAESRESVGARTP